MALVGRAGRAELGGEALAQVGRALEALTADVRPDVGVHLGGGLVGRGGSPRSDLGSSQLACRLGADARDGTAPTRMHHGEGAARSCQDDGHAVGEAQQRRHIGHRHHHAVGPFGSLLGHSGERRRIG